MRHRLRILSAVAVLGASVFVVGAVRADAAGPTLTAPERVYGLRNVVVPFAGDDPLSGDARAVTISATADDCAPTAENHYAVGGCARIQMTVGHGEIAIPEPTLFSDPLDPEGMTASGAIIETSTNGDGSGSLIYMNGTADQLNGALSLLTFTPDTDYTNHNDTPAYLHVLAKDGDPALSDSAEKDIEIRIDDLNVGPTLTVGSDQEVAAGSTTEYSAVAPPVDTNGDWFIEDPDVDEIDGTDYSLLVMFTTCGKFTLRGGALTVADDIKALLMASPLNLDESIADLIVAALPPEVTGRVFATGDFTNPISAVAAVGAYDEVNYGLSQVGFEAPGTASSCDLWTIVTDLGNNGLPIQYVGSPIGGVDTPQPGLELPDLGVDFGMTNFKVDGGVEVSVPAAVSVNEGSSVDIPISVSGPNHPAFDVEVQATDVSTSGGDYADLPLTPISFGENEAGPINLPIDALEDSDFEGPETFLVTVSLADVYPGIGLSNSIQTEVTIVDNDPEPTTTTDSTTTEPSTTTDSTTTEPSTTESTTTAPSTTTESTTTMPSTTTESTTTAPSTTTESTTTMPSTTTESTTTMPSTTTASTTTAPTTTTASTTTSPSTTTASTTTASTTTEPSTTTASTTTASTTTAPTSTTEGETTTTAPTSTTVASSTTLGGSTTTVVTVPGETTTTTADGTTTTIEGGSTTVVTGSTGSTVSTDTTVPGGGVSGNDGNNGTGGGGLARTGFQALAPIVVGFCLILVGLASVRLSRRSYDS